jgi:hypothetical protein
VFTARYALSSYIKQMRFVFKGLINLCRTLLHVALDDDDEILRTVAESTLGSRAVDSELESEGILGEVGVGVGKNIPTPTSI